MGTPCEFAGTIQYTVDFLVGGPGGDYDMWCNVEYARTLLSETLRYDCHDDYSPLPVDGQLVDPFCWPVTFQAHMLPSWRCLYRDPI